ncbi:leucine-rich repeats and immunoglobulin-like domains protein 1 [Pecten maximus]|uniref:leucine-rich repeats and immunoglobulin-like domains protein 1 n=1 Tax=Pecten maximus TaxID=6579 RepID=UPI001458BDCA|nr:leucine-rich repeats and immunoglobulin-like domains protein 1 [Pecten maximus]
MTRTKCLFAGLVLMTRIATILSQQCPSELCHCERGHPGKGRIINCRSRGLSHIPVFQPSDELFYELTLANQGNCDNCNNFTRIDANAFNGLKINVLRVDNINLNFVSNNAFNGLLMYIEEISLQGNGHHPPPYSALSTLTNLKKLTLKGFQQNSITRENSDFRRLYNLQELVLKNMDISYITKDAFKDRLPNLKKLRMEYLPLGSLPDSGLMPLTNLEELSAVYVNLRRIPFGAFRSFKKLKVLDLSHNAINDLVPDCFKGIEHSLEYLGLHLNLLDATNIGPLASPNWRKLNQLNIGHNYMKSLPLGLFYNMRSLEYLNLDSNRITSLESGSLLGLRNLTFLDLSGNMISSLAPGMFLHTPKLSELDLSGENTRRFNLTSEGLRGLEETLKKLYLKNTPVVESEMWRAVQNLHQVHTLQLDGTRLTEIPDFQFIHNSYLEELKLEQNRFSRLNEKTFYGLSQSLKILYLQGNQFRTIGKCVIQQLASLDTLYLGSNPLDCDCRHRFLRQWIIDRIADDFLNEYIIESYCDTPGQYKGTALWEIPEAELVCDPAHEEEMCENISTVSTPQTTSQTTSFPTLKPHTGNGSSVFRFTKIIETSSGIHLEWTAEEEIVTGFSLEYQLLGKTSEIRAEELHSSKRNFYISHLERNSHYLLCLRVNPRQRDLPDKEQRTCIAVRTLP